VRCSRRTREEALPLPRAARRSASPLHPGQRLLRRPLFPVRPGIGADDPAAGAHQVALEEVHSRSAFPSSTGSRATVAAIRHAATNYWITSSAIANNVSGIVRPSALAVLRLTIRLYLVGCTTGRSAGLAPLRILPA
jgi:hypothetical protein